MRVRKLLFLILAFVVVGSIFTSTAKAVELPEFLTTEDSILVKTQEAVEYFFAFRVEKRVEVLEKHAEKRLVMAQNYAEAGKQEKAENTLQDYLKIKDRQNELLGKTNSGEVLGAVAERTIEQQKTMEQIKLWVDEDGKEGVKQIQEQVVNQVAQHIVVVDGPEGRSEFFQEVEHVWAPGTGPGGGTSGVVIEGGESKYAPGTSAGGTSGVQYAGGTGPTTVVTGGVETTNDTGSNTPGGLAPGTTGGAPNDVVVTDGVIEFAPGTSEHGENNLAP